MSKFEKPFEWRKARNYPQKYYAVYDEDNCPDRLRFFDAEPWPSTSDEPVKTIDDEILTPPYEFHFQVDGEIERLLKYDILAETFGSPLVNGKVLKILQELCPNDFQAFETIVHAKGGDTRAYFILNILNYVDSIDMELSDCDTREHGKVRSINNLHFVPNCMGAIHLARDEKFSPMILVSEELKKVFKKNKIKGARFLEDQEAHSRQPITETLCEFFQDDPEAAKRLFVTTLNMDNEYAKLKNNLSKIPREIIEELIDMTLSRSSYHAEQCAELKRLLKNSEKDMKGSQK